MSKQIPRMLLVLALILPLLLSGCYEQLNPLVKNEATPVPGLSDELYAAAASDDNTDTIKATLYFRYLDEPMLAGESRAIPIRRDQRPEQAIIQALIAGPGTGNADLRSLLPADALVVSVSNNGQVLFVTFNEAFLSDSVPEDWATDEVWSTEAPLLRKLILQSIVASITESFPYSGVQFLMYRESEVQTSLRLNNEYFLDGSMGLSEPIIRDEALLLTPQSTVRMILNAWSQKDFQRLYKYLAPEGRPAFSAFAEALGSAPSVEVFSIGGGSVYLDGQAAVVTVFLRLITKNGQERLISYPLQLLRDNGIWKMEYTRLMALVPEI